MSSNYNEQYSRKNNIKVFNFHRREKQNLRQDFINLVKGDLNVTLEERDVVAIHRLPAEHEPSPLIVAFMVEQRMDFRRSFKCMMTLTLNSDNSLHNVLGGNFKFLMLKNI
jgi:hypothetical protein